VAAATQIEELWRKPDLLYSAWPPGLYFRKRSHGRDMEGQFRSYNGQRWRVKAMLRNPRRLRSLDRVAGIDDSRMGV